MGLLFIQFNTLNYHFKLFNTKYMPVGKILYKALKIKIKIFLHSEPTHGTGRLDSLLNRTYRDNILK